MTFQGTGERATTTEVWDLRSKSTVSASRGDYQLVGTRAVVQGCKCDDPVMEIMALTVTLVNYRVGVRRELRHSPLELGS